MNRTVQGAVWASAWGLLAAAALAAAPGQTRGAVGSERGTSPTAAVRRGVRGDTPTTVPLPANAARHEQFLAIARRGKIDVVMLGDSITDWWRSIGQPVWDEHLAPLRAANFGIAGDLIEQVLWRVQNGELDGYEAKLVVLMIGTNNFRGQVTDRAIVEGIALLTREILQRQPKAKLLLLGIFPRGNAPDAPWRPRIKAINAELAKLADGQRVHFLDIGDKFLAPDGSIPHEIMNDGLHPTLRGYEIWAEAMMPTVRALLSGQ